MDNSKLGIYHNIDKIDMLDDGSVNVLLKNGREAVIEIVKLNNKFTAAVYRWFGPGVMTEKAKKNMFAKLSEHEAYQECAREALGWIDENPLQFIKTEEQEIK